MTSSQKTDLQHGELCLDTDGNLFVYLGPVEDGTWPNDESWVAPSDDSGEYDSTYIARVFTEDLKPIPVDHYRGAYI